MLKRLKIKAVVAVALAFGLFNAHAVGQQYPAPSERQPPKEYHESALRRFEIVS